MGRQIIKQPNGKYCIFSSIVDNVTHYDMTVDDIIDEWISEEKDKITKSVNSIISKLENGETPYFQFTSSYENMLDVIRQVHGDKEFQEVKSLIDLK